MSRDRSLPIFELQPSFLEALQGDHARIVVEAPTGSGKSTQIPQFLADSGVCDDREIYVLQPRRLAARMLANRVAQERGGRLGDEVGYQVRFESEISSRTKIRFVTEGILIRKLIEQPDLADVAAVILDEFHERHFFGDISLARCLDVQRELRPDLKIVVMSATLETAALKKYLGDGSSHLTSDGRTFPVQIQYEPARERHQGELWDQICRVIKDQLKSGGVQGHILVFLPGRYEIQKTVAALKHASWSSCYEIHELYGELSPEKQDAAVSKSARPRIVVATNVAETSITIDGVTLVVDSGLERRSSFDHRRGITTLLIEKISRASADQRAGRAGRTGPGTAIRLWSERDHETRAVATPAEIHRMDLGEAIVILGSSGVPNVREFNWFESPDQGAFDEALRRLRMLNALDKDESLTNDGRLMGMLPVPPRFGRILLEAAREGCPRFFALLIALTQSKPLFPTRKKHSDHLMPVDFSRAGDVSDFQPLLRAWSQMQQNQFRRDLGDRLGIHAGAARDISRIADQLVRISARWGVDTHEIDEPEPDTLGKILLSGFPDRVALRHNASTLSCAVIGGRRGQLERESVAASKDARLFLVGEMIEIEGKDLSVKLDLCTLIREEWLRERFPQDFVERDGAVYDETNRKVEARREKCFGDLVLETKPSGTIPDGEAASILATKVLSGELNLKAWDDKVDSYFARINLVASECPEYEIVPVDEDAKQLLLEQICAGAVSYKQIKDRPVWPVLKEWLPPHQVGALDFLAPETLTLSTGKSSRILYRSGEKPRISVLIQHLFGLKDSPVICQGKVPVVIEILAPNHRPVQVTESLAGFWTGSYPAVRAQLRGRYPKHDWPEFE
jgi:ATP-dependent helicase HrpB